jgi:monoamine oxidase
MSLLLRRPHAFHGRPLVTQKEPHAMTGLTRRSFLATCTAAAAPPAWAAPRQPPTADVPRTGNVDVVIIGAGAAGIAAARRLLAAGRRVALIEATPEIGGRCITDTTTFGVPYDRGAHWIYLADNSPIAKLAPQAGLDLYLAPPGQRMRVGRRYAREGEMEDFLANLVRANTAISDAARKSDIACAQVLPKDLGEWRATIDFVLGAFGCGRDLAEVSTVDLARSTERDNGAFCRQGLGALVTRLAPAGATVLANPVTRIDWWRSQVEVQTAKGTFHAPTAIVTVSTNILTSGKIKFDLPKRHLDAANKLRLGTRDRVALELPGNPLGLRADELVLEKSADRQTAAVLGNVSGSTVCMVDVAGNFGRDLSGKGEAAMLDFAIGWLSGLFGNEIKKSVKRHHVMRWDQEPWVLGAGSVAAPGGQAARRILMEPVSGRIFLAGEAAHETLWGTLGGAWESGERAADAVLKLIGGRRG